MKILVTGAAGFIGFHLARLLLARGDSIVGVDNLSAYYDVSLKEARLAQLGDGFELVRADIADRAAMEKLFAGGRFDAIVHLAAQAGVRFSLVDPTPTWTRISSASSTSSRVRATTPSGHLVFASVELGLRRQSQDAVH